MKKLNVLMLGWHSSPLLSGGLGVASLGIAQALSNLVNLSLILPDSDPEVVLENIDLTGLSNLDVEKIKVDLNTPTYEVFAPVDYVKSDILPYQTSENSAGSGTGANGSSTVDSVRAWAATAAPGPSMPVPPPAAEDAETANNGNPTGNSEGKNSLFTKKEAYGDELNYKVIQYARYATRVASGKTFDVIYAHDWMTFQAGLELKRVTGKPLVLHVHTLSHDRVGPNGKGWIFEMEKNSLAQTDFVIAVSQYTSRILQEHYGVPKSKIHPVYHGLEPVSPFRTEKASAERLVVYLGRMTEQKGPFYFPEIAQKVLAERQDVRFVMAGTGPLLQDLKESETVKALGGRIEFPGFLDRLQVYDLLSRADVFVMPSVSEPYGLAALEAAQFGVPVVLSTNSGAAEVLRHALKAEPQDTDQMAYHVLRLLEDEGMRKRTITETFYDIENLTWENTAEEILDVFKQVSPVVK